MSIFDFLRNRKKSSNGLGGKLLLIAQLNARVQPIDRGDYFEDPLDAYLKELGIGEVTGGGTQLAGDPDGIKYCDIEIEVDEVSAGTINHIVRKLEDLGAPKGSLLKLLVEDRNIEFGKLEGMAIFLNGTDLPDDVYANSDVNQVVSELDEQIDGVGKFRGHWKGNLETALYFYGTNFESMKSKSEKYIAKTPLCQMARIEQIA